MKAALALIARDVRLAYGRGGVALPLVFFLFESDLLMGT